MLATIILIAGQTVALLILCYRRDRFGAPNRHGS